MKKRFWIPSLVMAVLGIAFAVYAGTHPALALPFTAGTRHVLYGVYAAVTVLLFLLARLEKKDFVAARIVSLVLLLGAVYFLVQSLLSDERPPESLPVALGLNAAALGINVYLQKKEQKQKRRGGEEK